MMDRVAVLQALVGTAIVLEQQFFQKTLCLLARIVLEDVPWKLLFKRFLENS